MSGWKHKIDSNLCQIKRPRMKAKVMELRLRSLLPSKLDHAQELVLQGVLPLVVRLHDMRHAWDRSGELHPDYSRTFNVVQAAMGKLGAAGAENEEESNMRHITINLVAQLKDTEREAVTSALECADGDMDIAAAVLSMTYDELDERVQRLGVAWTFGGMSLPCRSPCSKGVERRGCPRRQRPEQRKARDRG